VRFTPSAFPAKNLNSIRIEIKKTLMSPPTRTLTRPELKLSPDFLLSPAAISMNIPKMPLMPLLSYFSCLLTIASTVMVGRRMWQGWVVAGINSVIISAIGLHTAQWGFVPANLFCLAIYAYNLRSWRSPSSKTRAAQDLAGR